MIRRDLTQRAEDFNIILDDVSITELSFGREYTSAVEAKQVIVLEYIYRISKSTLVNNVIFAQVIRKSSYFVPCIYTESFIY